MYKKQCLNLVAALAAMLGAVQPGAAVAGGVQPFLGEIMWVPYNFAPTGWAMCDGQILSIAQNMALFSLLGTTYGGNGQTTFALPNAQGRVLVKEGQGPGLSNYTQGETGGTETVTLTASQMPAHTHSVQATNAVADQALPSGNVLAQSATGSLYGTNPAATLAATAVSTAGGSQPHNNMMPTTTLTCIIATSGIFPSRN
jgi:microcystin-dependent protein